AAGAAGIVTLRDALHGVLTLPGVDPDGVDPVSPDAFGPLGVVVAGHSRLRRTGRPAGPPRGPAFYDGRLVWPHIGADLRPRRLHACGDLTADAGHRRIPALPLLYGSHQLALTHACDAGNAERRGQILQLRQQHRGQSAAGASTAGSARLLGALGHDRRAVARDV